MTVRLAVSMALIALGVGALVAGIALTWPEALGPALLVVGVASVALGWLFDVDEPGRRA